MVSLYLDCINSGESNHDYGLLSKLDKSLTDNESIYHSFRGASSTQVQTVEYGVIPKGHHFIQVKYLKDHVTASGYDSLQFKIRFE